jgi:hypothetical protein
MTTSVPTPGRIDAPKQPSSPEDFAYLSNEDVQRCLGATETALRVARDRRDDVQVAELIARHRQLLSVLERRRARAA